MHETRVTGLDGRRKGFAPDKHHKNVSRLCQTQYKGLTKAHKALDLWYVSELAPGSCISWGSSSFMA